MNIELEGITASKLDNGLVIKSETPLYMLANRNNFDYVYVNQFDNHYFIDTSLEPRIVQRNGIVVISTVEYFENKFFTNISLILDVKLDNITLLNLFRTTVETIDSVSSNFNAINHDKLSNKFGNVYNMVYVACRGKPDKNIAFDFSLFYEVKEIVEEALEKSFKLIGYYKN